MRIEGKSLRKRFGRVEALRGVDFSIPKGAKVGLIGPNASGKSTLIRIILGLLRCEGGRLTAIVHSDPRMAVRTPARWASPDCGVLMNSGSSQDENCSRASG